jgi:hypothetical protein
MREFSSRKGAGLVYAQIFTVVVSHNNGMFSRSVRRVEISAQAQHDEHIFYEGSFYLVNIFYFYFLCVLSMDYT